MLTQQDIINRTADHVRGLLSAEGSHDWFHTERVRKVALHIAREERANLFIVELAALLHDVADWKFAGGDHKAGPRAARAWLTSLSVPLETIEHVCDIIAALSFKGAGVETPMHSLEGRCVQDADRLDALGAIGIARAFAYGGSKGRALYDPNIPPESHASFEAYKKNTGPTINHFYEKLLLLKERMNTETGKKVAAGRHWIMEEYLRQFKKEWNGDDCVVKPPKSKPFDTIALFGCSIIAFVVVSVFLVEASTVIGWFTSR